MERLTKTKIDVEKFSKKTKSRLTHEYFEMVKLNNKLCEYEDFMESFDFDNLEELDHYVQEIHNHYEEVKNKGTCGLCHYLDNEQLDLFKKENAELETKLAESENKVKDLEFRNKNLEHSLSVAPNANAGQRARIVELKGINHKLKQQLQEKDKVIENLRIDLKDWQELEKKLGTKYDKVVEQLSDKDKEIEDLNKFMSDKANEIEDLKERISNKITSAYGAELMAKDVQWHLEKEIQELKQSQNQTAIAKLEKVKEFAIKNKFVVSDYHNLDLSELNYGICLETICKQIDQQIKTLKRKK